MSLSSSPFPRSDFASCTCTSKNIGKDDDDNNDSDVYMFGGYSKQRGMMNDLWRRNGTKSWEEIKIDDARPPPRIGHTLNYMCFGNREVLVVFGGSNDDFLDDVWAIDLHHEKGWEQVKIAASNPSPAARSGHISFTDADDHDHDTAPSRSIWIHGGGGGNSGQGLPFGDMWRLSISLDVDSDDGDDGGIWKGYWTEWDDGIRIPIPIVTSKSASNSSSSDEGEDEDRVIIPSPCLRDHTCAYDSDPHRQELWVIGGRTSTSTGTDLKPVGEDRSSSGRLGVYCYCYSFIHRYWRVVPLLLKTADADTTQFCLPTRAACTLVQVQLHDMRMRAKLLICVGGIMSVASSDSLPMPMPLPCPPFVIAIANINEGEGESSRGKGKGKMERMKMRMNLNGVVLKLKSDEFGWDSDFARFDHMLLATSTPTPGCRVHVQVQVCGGKKIAGKYASALASDCFELDTELLLTKRKGKEEEEEKEEERKKEKPKSRMRGFVYTWGSNRHGQCGEGRSSSQITNPGRVAVRLPPVDAVYAGYFRTLVTCTDGTTWMFGDRIGAIPRQLDVPKPVCVGVGALFTLMLGVDGILRVLGNVVPGFGSRPEFGVKNVTCLTVPLPPQDIIDGLSGLNVNGRKGGKGKGKAVASSASRVEMVACGSTHALVLTQAGLVLAIGENTSAQCGVGAINASSSSVSSVSGLTYVPYFLEELRSYFAVVGQEGESEWESTLNRLRRPRIVSIACGGLHSACLSDEGHVFVFSANVNVGHSSSSSPVLHIGELDTLGIASLCCGPSISYGVSGDGRLLVSFSSSGEVVGVRRYSGNARISVLSAGGSHGMSHCAALMTTGDVLTWGSNDLGQLGRGGGEDGGEGEGEGEAVDIGGVKVWNLCAGASHCVALT